MKMDYLIESRIVRDVTPFPRGLWGINSNELCNDETIKRHNEGTERTLRLSDLYLTRGALYSKIGSNSPRSFQRNKLHMQNALLSV